MNWWRYNRLRYWWRWLRCCRKFFWRKAKGWFLWKFCLLCRDSVAMFVGMGMIDPAEAIDLEYAWQRNADSWVRWMRIRLGADSDHPDGIYAESPRDMIRMTEDEYEHWR